MADGITVHGTYLHPTREREPIPAAVLIAGSGPTDRNGNSPKATGSVNSLRNIAVALASAGVASLRYDKLGTGKTEMGKFAAHPNTIGIAPFTHEATGALKFLARQTDVDGKRLAVYGHSEGALFALLMATDDTNGSPPVHSIGLIEPFSKRYLDIITTQVTKQVHQQQASGKISKGTATDALAQLHKAVAQLRNKGTVPPDLGYGLQNLFTPSTLKFLRQADSINPASLAAKLPSTMPVLITCSDADIQVPCTAVQHLADAIPSQRMDFVHLHNVDHVLKQDPSKTASHYGAKLPFSKQLATALHAFARR